jgi:hypothetical protein
MNPHFDRYFDGPASVPDAVYAQIDHIEPGRQPDDLGLVAFDAIDAEWIKKQAHVDPCFDMDDLQRMEMGWRDYWAKVQQGLKPANPFGFARLYRVEIEMDTERLVQSPPGHPQSSSQAMQILETEWFKLERSPGQPGGVDAKYYPAAFAAPLPAHVRITPATASERRALTKLVTIDDLAQVNTDTLESELGANDADLLAVYDVGQGNANGLLAPSTYGGRQSTALYYDIGCGVYRNRSTTPTPLDFCFKLSPRVLLSHWDSDHWMGACVPGAGVVRPGLTLNWVAPLQTITSHHMTFALDVIAHGGTFRVYNPPKGTIGIANTPAGDRIKFTVGTGGGRNQSGIVVAIERDTDNGWRSWLLTGDCDYGNFLFALAPAPVVGLVVPHHGAAPVTALGPPAPAGSYRRIVYSFGSGNVHGSVRHPTAASVLEHTTAGWMHLNWAGVASPGGTVPGGDALATCEHPASSFRGGALLGWDAVPPLTGRPCSGGCSTLPLQV